MLPLIIITCAEVVGTVGRGRKGRSAQVAERTETITKTSERGRGRGRRGGVRRRRQRSAQTHSRGEASGVQGNQHSTTTTSRPVEERPWSLAPSEILVWPFVGNVGPNIPISADPTELFLQLFTPQLLDDIVTETNRYASLYLATSQW